MSPPWDLDFAHGTNDVAKHVSKKRKARSEWLPPRLALYAFIDDGLGQGCGDASSPLSAASTDVGSDAPMDVKQLSAVFRVGM
jgi:hypothetical protein